MKHLAYFLLILGFSTANVAVATLRRVPFDYPSIQEGIDASIEGDTVFVSPGTYYENIDFRGVNVYLLSQSGPEVTVIDGSDTGSVIRVMYGEDTTSVIDGFTITNGREENGGGFYVINAYPKIIHNIIAYNHAEFYGGGINVDKGGVVVRHNVFYRNHCASWRGGPGINATNSDIKIYNNLFYLQEGPAVIFAWKWSTGDVANNTIRLSWSGVSSQGYSTLYAKNNIITDMEGDAAFHAGDDSELYCSYNCTYNNYWDYRGCVPGPGALFKDPLFVGGDPFDYHLQDESPCIDAGGPASSIPAGATTMDGDCDDWPADMGYHFYPCTPPALSVLVTPDTTTVERGGTLGYTVELTNDTDEMERLDYWSDVYLWTGKFYGKNPVFGPKRVTVQAGMTLSGHLTHKVPNSAPLKTYTLCGRIGFHADNLWDEDCFEFNVVEGLGLGHERTDWEVIENTF